MKLIFVYNAKSGKLNSLIDTGHKLLSPDTYKCGLCTLTHDTFAENKVWKSYRENNTFEMVFYHADEFKHNFPNHHFDYPIVLKESKGNISVLLNRSDINKLESVHELISVLNMDRMDN